MKESSYLGQAKKHGKWPLSLRSCSRCSQRPLPAPVHSPSHCNLAHIPTVRAAFPCRRSFSCGRTCFTLSAGVAEKAPFHIPTMVTALITHSVQAASPFLLRSPLPYWAFLGSHMKNHKLPHTHPWTTQGQGDGTLWLGQPGSCPASVTWTWGKLHPKHMEHSWWKFSKRYLGGNYQNKSRFWTEQKMNNLCNICWSAEWMTPLGGEKGLPERTTEKTRGELARSVMRGGQSGRILA